MTNSLQDSQERNYWTAFQKNVYNLLQCTFRTEVTGPSIIVSWDDDKFKVNKFVYTIDFDKFALNPDDFERDFLEKFKSYLEGATNGKS
jgi:hypothetical protein